YVSEADEAVRLPGVAPADTYLRADLVIEAALRTGAQAVHPGYGFLSENAAFAAACVESGLVFVGPSVAAIEAMGSKIRAKELMAAAGVPVLPSITVPSSSEPGAGAAVLDEAAERIGFPILVKASFGGGGRGMRIVRVPSELADAIAAAQREAAAAFGNGTVFLERYVESPRHVEVQIFGDSHGTVVHLFERECSIQRRHQKIIEESPSPAVDDDLRDAICSAATRAAKAIGYVNAGTVEFVLEPDGRFWFLEVNTRLQVEHPVTELVTGLDLVRLQLAVAQGEPLPAEVIEASIHGHAVEARLYAEDVAAGFLPTSGPVHRLRVPDELGLRVDGGYVDGSVVTTRYDAMLAKVIAWAPTRAEAARRLAAGLARAEIHGVVTNRDLLVRVLRHPEFLAGHTDTGFLERHDVAALAAPLADAEAEILHGAAAAGAVVERERASSSPLPPGIPISWRNVGTADQPVTLLAGDRPLTFREFSTSAVDSRREVATKVHLVGDWAYVDSSLGSSAFRIEPRFPEPEVAVAHGSLLAPLPGTVVSVLVSQGDHVTAGQPLVALEAMKMEHTIRAPHDGVVAEVRVAVGDQVEPDAVLLVVDDAG
ncbi:MAG: ATP-grasp protein, partial [Acidimicrobiales bacterium]|nr:ATP-grasp protein [Acidimicrobiales bacterium]